MGGASRGKTVCVCVWGGGAICVWWTVGLWYVCLGGIDDG